MSVPAEKLTNAFTTIQENLQQQIVILKRVNEISETQLELANNVIKEMDDKSDIQDKLIESITAMNDRYAVLLQERDEFIESLRLTL